VEDTSAGRSLTRGTASGSPRRSARRTALATSVSWLAIDSRTDTPERWFTCVERRAWWVMAATISAIQAGTVTCTPDADSGRASWATTAISVSSPVG
jgi:hypothetical protein